MKVKIGPYKNWIGPYQIAEALCFWARKETDEYGFKHKPDWVHNFGTWLAEDRNGNDSWLQRACVWIESQRQRKIKVRINPWDTWSMDHTLAYIILPMLKQLNETKHGAPFVDDEDVPEHLRSTAAEPKENDWDTDSNHFLRWDWVMAEMIYAFECQLDDTWEDKYWTGEWGKTVWKETDHTYPNPKTGELEPTYSMEHTGDRSCDWDGLKKEQARIQNGFRLFGRYYQNLWD